MKRLFDTIRELFAENLKRSRENTKFIFDRADSFMVWIIGFLIGGLSLFLILARSRKLLLTIRLNVF